MGLVGSTLEIRSPEGELWFQRGFPVARAKEVVVKIMSSREFWSGGWSLAVRPFNENTDLEQIGNLNFLGDLAVVTKADRIRAKSDEEQAEMLFRVSHDMRKPLNKEEVLRRLQEPCGEVEDEKDC